MYLFVSKRPFICRRQVIGLADVAQVLDLADCTHLVILGMFPYPRIADAGGDQWLDQCFSEPINAFLLFFFQI